LGNSLQLSGLPAAAAGGFDAFGLEGAGDLAPAHALVAELGDPGPHGLVVLGLALAPGEGGSRSSAVKIRASGRAVSSVMGKGPEG